jgi:hypothetical protein
MNRSVLNTQFTDLEIQQRGLLIEYYRLITRSLAEPEEEIDHLAKIWSTAENDPVLCRWLCLIDYFYTNVPFSYELEDDDRRAYLSEYIELLVDEQQDNATAHLPNRSDEEAICVGSQQGYYTLICPDGSGYVLRSIEEMNSIDSTEWKNSRCDRCEEKLVDHRISCTEAPSAR